MLVSQISDKAYAIQTGIKDLEVLFDKEAL